MMGRVDSSTLAAVTNSKHETARMAAALEPTTSAHESRPPDASLDSYGRLLRMLMPSLLGVIVHDGFANLLWTSDEADLADDAEIVKDAISNALGTTTEFAGIMRPLD